MGLISELSVTDPFSARAARGQVFYGSDADQNDMVTGQTSFANTTPTFALVNPINSRVLVVPLMVRLVQAGTVAGADIDILMEIDGAPARFTSGTAETIKCSRTAAQFQDTARAGLYSTVTAAAGYGMVVDQQRLGPDISAAEAAVQQYYWGPSGSLDYIDPGGCLLIHTYAGTTGPTWMWGIKWAEIPLSEV